MTRENLAQALRWEKAKWVLVTRNAVFLVPQLLTVIWMRETGAISLTTLVLIFFIQIGFGFHGFVIRDQPLFATNVAGGTVTLATISAVVYFRYILG